MSEIELDVWEMDSWENRPGVGSCGDMSEENVSSVSPR